jgi:alpha-ribazole phosphatase
MQHKQFERVLVVTHGGVIKLLKCLAMNQPLDNILKMSAELGQLNRFVLHDNLTLQYLEQ